MVRRAQTHFPLHFRGGQANKQQTKKGMRTGRPKNVADPEFIRSRVKVDEKTGCWVWNGFKAPNGYGLTCILYKTRSVHRLSYEIFNGIIPAGLFVCHKCDNKPCCNPAHLFLGTASDNMRDCVRKGRLAIEKKSGQNHYRTKITEKQVEEIRSSSLSQNELAIRFGLDQSQISRIKNKKAHKQKERQSK